MIFKEDKYYQPYVVGFAFSPMKHQVLLIRKNKPDWQKGYLNGVGGKVGQGETPLQAMRREFYEEAGLRLRWTQFCQLSNPLRHGDVHFFNTICDLKDVKQMTDEVLEICMTDKIQTLKVIPNLCWLIPMAMDPEKPRVLVNTI